MTKVPILSALVLVVVPHKLCITLTPKVASTTLLGFAMELVGEDIGDENPRKYARKHADRLAEKGLLQRRVLKKNIHTLAEEFPGFKWVAAVRNPYARAASAYRSKVHRFAKEHRKGIYLWTGLIKTLKGPKHWDNSRTHAIEAANYISFEDFLEGLAAGNVETNGHFDRQSTILEIPSVTYDLLLRQERLAEDVASLRRMVGLDAPDVAALSEANVTRRGGFDISSLSAREVALVNAIYASDFANLGYDMVDPAAQAMRVLA
ncbi:sulfotransferase family 2 domain-containing protein [Shimia sp. SDUM112013]|uniref:sulfotransferase family 2 domain-containing protein n=1 Tax=Shimia sp. SDUM112013 TaxID=3136160 RepID=UPI0032ED8F1E